jgi:hypothetical protein
MLTKITMAIVATTLLASAVAAPALAQRAPSSDQNAQGGTFHGQPLSEWYRADGW